MTEEFPPGLSARHPVPDDHGRVLAVLDTWWGGFGGPDGPPTPPEAYIAP